MARLTGDRIRVAVIGAGAMANRVHYPCLASFPDVEIAAVCDVDATRLHETANRWHIARRYDDYRQMIEHEAPDAVYAIGQPHIFYDIWRWCLERGLNLYIEKPMGITLHQATTLAHLADTHGCTTQVSFQRRASPLAVMLKNRCLVRGAIVHAVCRFYKCDVKPFLEARDHMLDDGVHAIDTLRWLCEGKVAAIHDICRRISTPDINFISALLEFDSGSTGVMLCSWTSGRRVFSVEMHAPGICAEADLESWGRLYADGSPIAEEFDARAVARSDDLHVFGGFVAKHREFLDCLKSGRLPSSHFGDALQTMQVAERILAQTQLRDL